jgi:hypothetical protein
MQNDRTHFAHQEANGPRRRPLGPRRLRPRVPLSTSPIEFRGIAFALFPNTRQGGR